jgi:hypothetical protein
MKGFSTLRVLRTYSGEVGHAFQSMAGLKRNWWLAQEYACCVQRMFPRCVSPVSMEGQGVPAGVTPLPPMRLVLRGSHRAPPPVACEAGGNCWPPGRQKGGGGLLHPHSCTRERTDTNMQHDYQPGRYTSGARRIQGRRARVGGQQSMVWRAPRSPDTAYRMSGPPVVQPAAPRVDRGGEGMPTSGTRRTAGNGGSKWSVQ